jgi:hypothetical protein
MKMTESIIGILKDEFGDKDENRQKKTKKVRKAGRTATGRIPGSNSN